MVYSSKGETNEWYLSMLNGVIELLEYLDYGLQY